MTSRKELLIRQLIKLVATYEQHKTGRTITAFSFKFKQKPQAKNPKKLTPKQLDMFAHKLSELPSFQNYYQADIGVSLEKYARDIRVKLEDTEYVKKWLPFLNEIGCKSK